MAEAVWPSSRDSHELSQQNNAQVQDYLSQMQGFVQGLGSVWARPNRVALQLRRCF